MGQRLIISESERNQIRSLYEQVVQGKGNDPYEYKKEGDNYFARKKGSTNWVLAKGDTANAIATKVFRNVTKTTVKSPMSDPKFYSQSQIDQLKDNERLDQIQGLQTKKIASQQVQPEKELGMIDSVVGGFKKWVRKTYPNISQLFFARDLSTDDFSESQLEEIRNVVQNAIKRTGKKIGGTEYEDYGSNIVQKWFGPGGVKTTDMIANTVLADPKFMVATTLGRFSYSLQNGKIKITDIYDFKKIPDAKTEAKDLLWLPYPQKVLKIMTDNGVNPYVAIRHLAYLEHPQESPISKPKINIEIPLEATA